MRMDKFTLADEMFLHVFGLLAVLRDLFTRATN